MLTSDKNEKKGKLEIMLDEFTSAHGTVLIGMHKELQTLKSDIEQRVENQIGRLLQQIQAADTGMLTNLEKAQKTSASIDKQLKSATQVIADANDEAHTLIKARSAELRDFSDHACTDLDTKIAQLTTSLNHQLSSSTATLSEVRDSALDRISARSADLESLAGRVCREIDAKRAELQTLNSEIDAKREGFTAHANTLSENLKAMLNEHQAQMGAALKFANQISSECAFSLEEANSRYELLQQREAALQKRTRQFAITVGIITIVTIGLWLWLLHGH